MSKPQVEFVEVDGIHLRVATQQGKVGLPLLLFKLVVAVLIFVISLPLILISIVAAVAAVIAAFVLPLIPFILLLALIWYLVRPEPQALARG